MKLKFNLLKLLNLLMLIYTPLKFQLNLFKINKNYYLKPLMLEPMNVLKDLKLWFSKSKPNKPLSKLTSMLKLTLKTPWPSLPMDKLKKLFKLLTIFPLKLLTPEEKTKKTSFPDLKNKEKETELIPMLVMISQKSIKPPLKFLLKI